MVRKKRVLIGMSGGVDSSVAAALLKKRGYEVIGITMQMLPSDEKKESACCNINTISDAKRVCHQLNIPHYIINIRENFRKHVMTPFVSSYLNGETPNPCVECNRHIKFDELEAKAQEMGADYVATGHYCKRIYSPYRKKFILKKPKDSHKDQTYFLYMLTEKRLAKTLFPLGNLLKSEIRQLALDWGLVNAKRPESQEICFVTSTSYKEFIAQETKGDLPEPGDIVDKHNKVLGQHNGIHTVTIGQRKGLGIAHPEPLYVLKIEAKTNRVIVGQKEEMLSVEMVLNNWSSVDSTENILGKTFQVKSRYNMTPFEATVTAQTQTHVILHLPIGQTCLAPGQSGVLYADERVVGGGIIEQSHIL